MPRLSPARTKKPKNQGSVPAAAPKHSRRTLVGKVLLLVATLVVCGLPVLLIASPISYVPLIMALLLIALSWAYVHVLKNSFSFDESQMDNSCERGKGAGLRVRLSNTSILPHICIELSFYITDLFGEYDALRTTSVVLGPRETRELDLSAQFSHLGRYSAGIDHVVIHDLIGLFTARIDNTYRRTVVVRPRLFTLTDADISQTSEEDTNSLLKPVSSDNADYASVREYRYGDPMKTIHWNLTARNTNGTMYTRLYETLVNPSLTIIIDPFSRAGDPEVLMELFDGLVEASAALSQYARQQGIECTISYLNREMVPLTACLASQDDADKLVLDMRRISSTQSGSVGSDAGVWDDAGATGVPIELLRSEGTRAQGASNIAFASSRIDEQVISALLDLYAHGRNAVLLLAVPRHLAGAERTKHLAPLHQLASAGVPYVLIESNEYETKVVTA